MATRRRTGSANAHVFPAAERGRPTRTAPPPATSYAAPPPALTRFDEKRVVRLVRSEVKTTLSQSTPLERLSRADVGRLADEVYTTLARRLLVERERRGIA